MRFLKDVFGLLFRLFPCSTEIGLRAVGRPDRASPVLVTCNFHTTVRRLTRVLERADIDAWLLVAGSRGVNVWCAACGDAFNTHSVVSALKVSGLAERVDHRRLVLPPLGATGIRADEIHARTGWSARWGPVRAEDLPRYLAGRGKRDEAMRRVTWSWRERLDTALGSLFPFYFAAACLLLLLAPRLLPIYGLAAAASFSAFMLAAPRLPFRHGLSNALALDALLGLVLLASERIAPGAAALHAGLGVAMASFLFCGTELGGLASTLRSDLDPALARAGIGKLGNISWAGSVRTELLNGFRELRYTRERCNGCRRCVELCPQGVWEFDAHKRAVLAHRDQCTCCRACLSQCPTGAIEAPRVEPAAEAA